MSDRHNNIQIMIMTNPSGIGSTFAVRVQTLPGAEPPWVASLPCTRTRASGNIDSGFIERSTVRHESSLPRYLGR